MAWQRLKRICYERLIRPILFVVDTPRSKAGGVALGVFIAFTPTVGIQMPIAFGLATLFGVNQPLAVAMAWLTNPVTVPPIYYFEYRVGAWLLGKDAIGSSGDFWRHWEAVSAQYPGYWERVAHLAGDVGFPLFLGSLPVAVILAVISYPLTLWMCTRRAAKVEAQTLHPVAGEILPEPAHDEAADATATAAAPSADPSAPSKLLRLDDAARQRERPSGPTSSAGLVLLAATSALALHGCAEPSDRFTTRGEQAESRTEGELPLFHGWCDPQTLAVVAPYHAAQGRDRRLQEQVQKETSAAAPRRCVALTLFRFEEPATFVPSGALALEGVAATGSFRSLAPSDVLRDVANRADASVLGAQLGAAGMPSLKRGQLVRLLVVLPGEIELGTVTQLALVDGSRSEGAARIPLVRASVGAVRWDEFRSQPSQAAFERLIGAPANGARSAAANPGEAATDPSTSGEPTKPEERRDDGDGTGGK